MKFIKTLLVILLIFIFTGCSTNVNSLMEKGEYEEALLIVEKNPDKYSDVYNEIRYNVAKSALENGDYERAIMLLENNYYAGSSDVRDKALNLKSAIDIENEYNKMIQEKDEYNPDSWQPNFDYMDGIDFYFRLNDMLNDTYDTIVKDDSLENVQNELFELFGRVPSTVHQAKLAIEEFRQESNLNNLDKMLYAQPYALDYVMDALTKYNSFVRFELTKTSGYMIIEKPHDFLKSKEISSKTFAYLLGVCEDYGATISRNNDKIEVHWEYWENARGYYYCAPNSQHDALKNLFSNTSVTLNEAILYDKGLEVKLTFSFSEKINAKYVSTTFMLTDRDGNEIADTYSLKKDVNSKSIKYTLFFDDVKNSDLPGSEYNINFLWTVVFNE